MVEKAPISIPEGDYLSILDIITKFYECNTRDNLKTVFKNHVLPLFNADSALYGWINCDISGKRLSNPQIMDCVGIPEEDYKQCTESLPYMQSVAMMMQSVSRPVLAVDVDIPRKNFEQEKDRFFSDNPEFVQDSWLYKNPVANFISTFDQPEVTHGLGIHRHAPLEKVSTFDKPFTLRDVRVLELIRPHLLQTIKSIMLNDELDKYRSLMKTLVAVTTPIALIQIDMRVIFSNQAFKSLLGIDEGKILPEDLVDILKKEFARFQPPYNTNSSPVELNFYQLPEGTYRLSFCLLEKKTWADNPCWLLQMKPVSDIFSNRNLVMQQAGLSKVEMEIACLVCDGIEVVAIAARLFLSTDQVSSHLGKIYESLGIQTHEQLLGKLNQMEARKY